MPILKRDFQQLAWDSRVAEDCRQLVRLAVREDLEREQDWTTVALVPPDREGSADIVARQAGIVAGLPAVGTAIDEMGANLSVDEMAADRQAVAAGTRLARISGSVRDLLTCERILLNFLGRLMGIATLTDAFVRRIAGTGAHVYDTRKTTPGWRRLEKYAVGCGGGRNHRTGLYDAVLIKDNHLAQWAAPRRGTTEVAADAVRQARKRLREAAADRSLSHLSDLLVEVEVDSLEQLSAALSAQPDIVLLDNMSIDQLRQAVAIRNARAGGVELEASGGVTLESVREIAETGVERISAGSLTHGARSLDVALDWAEDTRREI